MVEKQSLKALLSNAGICILLCCFFVLFNCVDSSDIDKTSLPPVSHIRPPNPTSDRIDAISSSTLLLRIDSGFVGARQCTLYIYTKYCNGIIRIRLGEKKNNYTIRDVLTKRPYCPDSTWTDDYITYVFPELKPQTKYFLNLYGTWGDVTNIPWTLDTSFTTRPDSSADTSSKTGP
jgi:hypothetical protein